MCILECLLDHSTVYLLFIHVFANYRELSGRPKTIVLKIITCRITMQVLTKGKKKKNRVTKRTWYHKGPRGHFSCPCHQVSGKVRLPCLPTYSKGFCARDNDCIHRQAEAGIPSKLANSSEKWTSKVEHIL
jgi:hypothetical protein